MNADFQVDSRSKLHFHRVEINTLNALHGAVAMAFHFAHP